MKKILCCSIFREEMEALKSEHLFEHDVKYITSMLHMNPSKLESLLTREIIANEDNEMYLIYGDCCPAMHDFTIKKSIHRTEVHNCCELLLGKEEYVKLIKDGAFFLMPEWVEKWKEVFLTYMKLNKEVAIDMMNHLHKYFLYLDSGRIPIPQDTLSKISEYFGLPYKILKIDLQKNLLTALNALIQEEVE